MLGEPLAIRMRPKKLSEFYGQEEIIGDGKLSIVNDAELPSIWKTFK